MSERDERDELDERGELEIEAITELLESGALGFGRPVDHAEEAREYVEVVGLLPFELDPQEPGREVKGRLMAAIREDLDQKEPDSVVRFQPSRETVSGTEAAGNGSRGLQLLAAAMVLLAIALAATTGWMFATVRAQGQRIAALHDDLRNSRLADQQLVQVRQDLAHLQDQFRVVTEPGVEVCPLRPRGSASPQPDARGLFYISPDRSQWVLTAQGLAPCEPGTHYRIWFQTDGGPVSGGGFHAQEGARIEIGADQLPEGLRAVMVTIEADDGEAEPVGPTVLYGDDAGAMIL